jgi:hypothetical protein
MADAIISWFIRQVHIDLGPAGYLTDNGTKGGFTGPFSLDVARVPASASWNCGDAAGEGFDRGKAERELKTRQVVTGTCRAAVHGSKRYVPIVLPTKRILGHTVS